MSHQIPTAIVGVGGYTGQELVKIVAGHPKLVIAGLFGSSSTANQRIERVAPALTNITSRPVNEGTPEAIAGSGAKVAFLATPHEASVTLAGELLERGLAVVDLSAAFRLSDPAHYPEHYGFTHARPGLLGSAVYGLPELDRSRLPGATLVASPGCYPTSAITPLAPLIRNGLIDTARNIIIDATSGVSGAGRKASERTSFCEVGQSPYGVFSHRHQPEIDQYAGAQTIFTPHLGPYPRGICSTIHATLAEGTTEGAIRQLLHDAYANEPFVRLLDEGAWPSVAAVAHTNFIDIQLAAQDGHLIIVSCIDNLLKGASGQAVQALNACMGWDERLGLLPGSAL
ncbi:MAG: N-acetyl-gamma-glutamyl-phosphate reductase [Planctomycetota bacterium]